MFLKYLLFFMLFVFCIKANETVRNEKGTQECRHRGLSNQSNGNNYHSCCDYSDCPLCGFYSRCCY